MIVKNKDIVEVLVGVPRGHKHLRIILKRRGGDIFIFSEAIIANIVRAYITLKTHPIKRAIKLKQKNLSEQNGLKMGHAKYHLVEENIDENRIIDEITEILNKNSS